jgi:hypothetical protein
MFVIRTKDKIDLPELGLFDLDAKCGSLPVATAILKTE